MTWLSVSQATTPATCLANGCTAVVSAPGQICQWHRVNGLPQDIRCPKTERQHMRQRLTRNRARVVELNRQIGLLRHERDQLVDETHQLESELGAA